MAITGAGSEASPSVRRGLVVLCTNSQSSSFGRRGVGELKERATTIRLQRPIERRHSGVSDSKKPSWSRSGSNTSLSTMTSSSSPSSSSSSEADRPCSRRAYQCSDSGTNSDSGEQKFLYGPTSWNPAPTTRDGERQTTAAR
eukprot:s4916_g1.t1